MAGKAAQGWGPLSEEVKIDMDKLKDELAACINENETNKELVEAASLAMGTTRIVDAAEEAIPLEAGGTGLKLVLIHLSEPTRPY